MVSKTRFKVEELSSAIIILWQFKHLAAQCIWPNAITKTLPGIKTLNFTYIPKYDCNDQFLWPFASPKKHPLQGLVPAVFDCIRYACISGQTFPVHISVTSWNVTPLWHSAIPVTDASNHIQDATCWNFFYCSFCRMLFHIAAIISFIYGMLDEIWQAVVQRSEFQS